MAIKHAFVSPKSDGADDTLVRPSNWNADHVDVKPSCRVYHNVSQNIPNITWTILAFNSEKWDTDAMHDLVTNNERITCKVAGKYLCEGVARFSANATGARHVGIRKNGSWSDSAYAVLPAVSDQPIRVLVSIVCELAVNDYITMSVYQNSGATLTTDYVANSDFCWMAMIKLSD